MARNRQKEVELNVPEDDLNKADLKKGNHPGKRGGRTNKNRSQRRAEAKSERRSNSKRSGRSRDNDKNWHSNPKQLVMDAASFATQYPMGVRTPEGYCGMASELGRPDDHGTQSLTPAILVMDFIPTAGLPTESQAPVNQAARLQYAYVRYANSGSPVGNPSHLMKFYIAADSLYMLHQTGVRAYGCISQVNYLNQYLPKTLVEALGFDYDDLIANSAQFRYNLNLLAMALRRITVPNNMDYLKRHLWMVQGIYTDSESPRAQMYAFRPVAFYKYVEAEHETLEYVKVPSKFTVNSFNTLARELLDAVLQSESFGVTTADILKAYGGDNLVILPEITDTYQVIPIYSEEVMAIVENSTIVDVSLFDWNTAFALEDDLNPLGDNWIKVKTPYMEYSAEITYTDVADLGWKLQQSIYNLIGNISSGMQAGTLLNVHSAVSQEDIMTFTTLTANYGITVTVNVLSATSCSMTLRMEPKAVRSEMIINARIWASTQRVTIGKGASNLNINSYLWKTTNYLSIVTARSTGGLIYNHPWNSGKEVSDLLKAARFSNFLDSFDWHPACPSQFIDILIKFSGTTAPYVGVAEVGVSSFDYYGDGRDLENVVYLTRADLMRMAEVDLISLFDAPEIAILSAKPYSKS